MNGKGSDQRPRQVDKKLLKIIGIGYLVRKRPKKMLKKINQSKSNWVPIYPIQGYPYGQ